MEFQATHISLEFFEENSTSKGMFGGQISLKVSICIFLGFSEVSICIFLGFSAICHG